MDSRNVETVDASFLAKELLQYASSPASQEELEALREFLINPVSEQRFREELLFLKLFLVDDCLGSMSVARSGFTLVRMKYNQGICSYCADMGFGYPTIAKRFEIYARACNAYPNYDPDRREQFTPYWEIGKAFHRFVSDGNPDARELSIFGTIFSSDQLRLAGALANLEISIVTS